MKNLSTFLSVASGVFAVIPGITILTTNLGVPPDSSKALFAGIIEVLGILTLLILWINRETIQRISVKNVTKISICVSFIFIISLFSYLFIYNYYVESVPNSESLFFPFWPEGDLKMSLLKFGGRSELIENWGRDDVYKVIQSSSRISLLITTLIFLLVYQFIFVSLTFVFGLLGIKGM